MFDKVHESDTPFREPLPTEVILNQFSTLEFGLPDPSLMTEDEALTYLADILIAWYYKTHVT
jgi:hypothetical protein